MTEIFLSQFANKNAQGVKRVLLVIQARLCIPFGVEHEDHERQDAEHHELLVQAARQVHIHVAVFLANLRHQNTKHKKRRKGRERKREVDVRERRQEAKGV